MPEIDLVSVLIGPSDAAMDVNDALVMRRTILDTIGRATSNLLVVGYMIDDPQIVEKICSKAGSILTEVHVDRKQTMEYRSAMDAASKLEMAGAEVKMHDEGWRESLHAKVIVADGKEAIVGSANLTSRGADRNYEIGVRVRGPSARKLREALRKTLGVSDG